jgi:hypothetical protein
VIVLAILDTRKRLQVWLDPVETGLPQVYTPNLHGYSDIVADAAATPGRFPAGRGSKSAAGGPCAVLTGEGSS